LIIDLKNIFHIMAGERITTLANNAPQLRHTDVIQDFPSRYTCIRLDLWIIYPEAFRKE